jgi:hypothetical protein
MNSAFQLGHHTRVHAFEWLQNNDFAGFRNHMAQYSLSRARWCDPGCFPVDEVLVKGFKQGKDEVFLVDVGGSTGHDLLVLHEILQPARALDTARSADYYHGSKRLASYYRANGARFLHRAARQR